MKEIRLIDEPKISIVMPVHNAERSLVTALDTLLKQSFANFELIIVDASSTDKTKTVADKFSFDRRVRYVRVDNSNIGHALNVGHSMTQGEYLTWCKADGIYYANFLSVLAQALDGAKAQGANLGLVYSDFVLAKPDGKIIQEVLHAAPQTKEGLAEGYDVGMSFMYTRDAWEKTGEYWERPCEDYNWCVRASQCTGFGLVKAILAGLRVYASQIDKETEEAAADCRALAAALLGD